MTLTASAAPTVGVDPQRWPDIARVPDGVVARVGAPVAARLFRHAVSGLDVRVELPDGVILGSSDPTAPLMTVHRPHDFARRVAAGGLIGFGEAYMAGDWTAPDLAAVLIPFAASAASLIPRPLQSLRRLVLPGQPSSERNSMTNTRSNISRHYDLSNELFAQFLDPTMTYSSGYFGGVQPSWDALEAAQVRKIDRLLDAAHVGPGTRLLEIGTGWGELAIRAARRGATVRSVTLSVEQQELARARVAAAGCADSVQIDLRDYRAVDGRYDAIVSVEMIEAVGHQYWATYFENLDRLLEPGGRVGLQAITMPDDRMRASRDTFTWIHKYVFPGGCLPSTESLEVAAGGTALRTERRDRFGGDYAATLRLWRDRFTRNASAVSVLGFDDTFRRMWEFYLAYSEAGFAAGYLDVQQITLRKEVTR